MVFSSSSGNSRKLVVVRAGFSRQFDGAMVPSPTNQVVIRFSDSAGRLEANFVTVEAGGTYGSPLHVHHNVDEWLFILAGEFVAEVGGERLRLYPGDSLLMPIGLPHRWSQAGTGAGRAMHTYIAASPVADQDESEGPLIPKSGPMPSLDEIQAKFEQNGMTYLGDPLTKEEIDQA